jgi:uncharacterized protein YerC
MAKYANVYRLSRRQQEELLIKLAQAITVVRTLEEAASLIQDLLTKSEATMLAKRLAIADALIDGLAYSQITQLHKVSNGTIARVSEWLRTSGRGYQLLRTRQGNHPIPTRKVRPGRRATVYNWPLVALEELIAASDDRQRRTLGQIFAQLDEKSALFRELQPALVEYAKRSRQNKKS